MITLHLNEVEAKKLKEILVEKQEHLKKKYERLDRLCELSNPEFKQSCYEDKLKILDNLTIVRELLNEMVGIIADNQENKGE